MNQSMSEDVLELDSDGMEAEDLGDLEETRSDPFNPKDVDIQVMPSIMDAIIKRLRNEEIELSPDFQRSADLWKKTIQGRLIESLLINLPIPAFYFDATNDESWQIVDGLQRLSTIKSFVIDKKLKLTGLEFLKEYEGKSFDDLPRTLQRRIEEFQVTLYLIKPGTPENMKYSLFHRINTGGLSLKPQEIRHAISQGTNNGLASNFLKSLSESESFCRVVSIKGKRMSNCELVLRHVGFVIQGMDAYKSSMVRFLDEGMVLLGKCTEAELEQYKISFERSMQLAWSLFSEHAFKKSFTESARIRVVNKPLFESLSVALSGLTESQGERLIKQKEGFLREFKTLMKETKFLESISKSTANKDAFHYRFTQTVKLVNQFSKETSC